MLQRAIRLGFNALVSSLDLWKVSMMHVTVFAVVCRLTAAAFGLCRVVSQRESLWRLNCRMITLRWSAWLLLL